MCSSNGFLERDLCPLTGEVLDKQVRNWEYLRERFCRGKENVFGLQVAVNDVLEVQMPQGHKDLLD